tara:strand:+ start:1134 stop:2129 length:996 start_codon:yes stop_codon:yes gene_type:complete
MINIPIVYGIGNPLVDIIFHATDKDIEILNLKKGSMDLVNEKRQKEIIDYFKIENCSIMPGGSAPNTILACNGLGVPSVLSGKIGNDKFGDIYLDQINRYNVLSQVVQGRGPTGTSVVLITPDAERTMNTHLGMCREYSDKDIDEELLSRSSFLYFTGYMWDTDSQKEAIQKAVSIARSNNIKICLDVADPFVVERNKEEFLEFIKKNVDIVFANKPELTILFQYEDIELSIKELMKIVKCGCVKMGEKGSVVFNNSEIYQIQPKEISAIDTTGAGDMYAAGFLSSFSKSGDYKISGKIGSIVAEEIIQINGAQFSKDEIDHIRSKISIFH